MTRQPVAYLRRSYVDPDSPGDISREAQRAKVAALAAADGESRRLVEYVDWGISADIDKVGKRTEYERLLLDIAAGRVSTVYAFDLDRLYRDPRDLIRLQDAARPTRTRIVTTSGTLAIGEDDDPSAEAFALISAAFGRMELMKSKKRARAAMKARIASGEKVGRKAYGAEDQGDDLPAVVGAFEEAGSYLGAARLLNERGVPSWMATHRKRTDGPLSTRPAWSATAVRRILLRHRPDLVPMTTRRGAPTKGAHLFAGLLRCHCGATMRTMPRPDRSVGYWCGRAHQDRTHPRPYVIAETKLRPWIEAEAARLRMPGDLLEHESRRASEVLALDAKRARIVDLFAEGLIDKPDRDRRLAALAAQADALEAERRLEALPQAVSWSAPVAETNAVLRALFERVDLGPDLLPVAAEWRLPEWRSA